MHDFIKHDSYMRDFQAYVGGHVHELGLIVDSDPLNCFVAQYSAESQSLFLNVIYTSLHVHV